MKKIACFLLALFGIQSGVNADIITDTVRLTCAKELKYIELSQANINGSAADKAFIDGSVSIYKKYGVLNIRNFPDVKESNANKNQDGSFSYFCNIDNKSYELELSTNNGINCSGSTFLFLTLKENDKVLINNVALGDCNKSIDLVKILPDEGYIQLFGNNGDDARFYSIHHLKNLRGTPINKVLDSR